MTKLKADKDITLVASLLKNSFWRQGTPLCRVTKFRAAEMGELQPVL